MVACVLVCVFLTTDDLPPAFDGRDFLTLF